MKLRELKFLEMAVAALLLIYPVAMLTIKGGMNAVFLLMLLLALGAWLWHPARLGRVTWRRDWVVYAVAMCGLSLAIFLSQLANGDFAARPYDAASRYWLGIPVFLLLLRLHPDCLHVIQVGFPVAAIAGWALSADVGGGRSGINSMDLIRFGDFELILGVLSLFMLNWPERDGLAMRALKVAGFVAGVAASLASGSRGGWLAIPVFIALGLYFGRDRLSPRMILAALAAVVLGAALLYAFNASVNQRITQLKVELGTLEQAGRDSSTGIRWQLYKAAADVFVRHPVFGAGPQGFPRETQAMMEAGKLTPTAAALGRLEVHSDLLSKPAELGIFGLVALLAIYLVPLRLFWRAAHLPLASARRAGRLGVIFVSGFIVFGLTVDVLKLTMAAAFYSFSIAVLLAAAYNTHYDAQAGSHHS